MAGGNWRRVRGPKITIGDYYFVPGVLVWVLFLIGVTIFIALGSWQLDRAEQKRQLIEKRERMRSLPAVELIGAGSRPVFQQVRITGSWYPGRDLLQDNVTIGREQGFHILSPFVLSGGNLVLVDRGWKKWGQQRKVPSLPSLEEGVVSMEGEVARPLRRLSLQSEGDLQSWPRIVASVDFAVVERWLGGGSLLPFIVRLKSDRDDGLVRQWKTVYGVPEKHNGYALQWFAFAAVLTMLFVFLNTHKKSNCLKE